MTLDNILEQGIIQLNRASSEVSKHQQDSVPGVIDFKTPKQQMKEKIVSAQKHGLQEIEEFKKLTEAYLESINQLALYGPVSNVAKALFLESFHTETVVPIMKGQRPIGMSQEQFKQMKLDFYRLLLSKYED